MMSFHKISENFKSGGRISDYWQASQVPTFSMVSREQAFFPASLNSRAAVWVGMGGKVKSYLLRVIGEEED
jgi:hypothetical protein